MKKTIAFMLLGLSCCVILHAQNVVHDSYAEVRKVSPFTRVKVSGAIDVYLSQGNREAVAISSDGGKYNDKIRTDVSDGVLKIYVDKGVWNNWNWSNKQIKAYITIKEMEGLDVGGACSVKLTDPFTVGNLDLEISGASNLKGTLKASSLNVDLSGASSIAMEGSASDMKIDASGASSFKGYEFSTLNCNASASGASGINVTVTKDLKADASGASSVSYKGSAVISRIDVSGGSTVKKRD